MNLQGVAHRRLSHAGRADRDDAVDHPFFLCCGGALLAVLWLLAPRACCCPLAALPGGKASDAAGAAGMRALGPSEYDG